jgi:hypothetical protein
MPEAVGLGTGVALASAETLAALPAAAWLVAVVTEAVDPEEAELRVMRSAPL